jgi:hypothetical protein
MVRRPERLVISQYQQMRFGLFESARTFESAWRDRIDNGAPTNGPYSFARDYPRSGSVGAIFGDILNVVPRKSLHVIIYEEFFDDPPSVLLALLKFLEIDPFEYSVNRINSAKTPIFSSLHNQIINQGLFFRMLRFLVRSIPGISASQLKKFYDNRLVKSPAPIADKEMHLYLEKYFEKEKKQFEFLLGRKVRSWWE